MIRIANRRCNEISSTFNRVSELGTDTFGIRTVQIFLEALKETRMCIGVFTFSGKCCYLCIEIRTACLRLNEIIRTISLCRLSLALNEGIGRRCASLTFVLMIEVSDVLHVLRYVVFYLLAVDGGRSYLILPAIRLPTVPLGCDLRRIKARRLILCNRYLKYLTHRVLAPST